MGRALQQSKEAYGKVVGSYESRLRPQLNKFKALGAGSNQDLPEIKDIEGDTKKLTVESAEETEESSDLLVDLPAKEKSKN